MATTASPASTMALSRAAAASALSDATAGLASMLRARESTAGIIASRMVLSPTWLLPRWEMEVAAARMKASASTAVMSSQPTHTFDPARRPPATSAAIVDGLALANAFAQARATSEGAGSGSVGMALSASMTARAPAEIVMPRSPSPRTWSRSRSSSDDSMSSVIES